MDVRFITMTDIVMNVSLEGSTIAWSKGDREVSRGNKESDASAAGQPHEYCDEKHDDAATLS